MTEGQFMSKGLFMPLVRQFIPVANVYKQQKHNIFRKPFIQK